MKATLDTDTKEFTYDVTYSGLTGPAVAAHFHGPAAPGVNAPPVIVMTTLTSPISGSATLTDAQIADLEAGKWYFNVHTPPPTRAGRSAASCPPQTRIGP